MKFNLKLAGLMILSTALVMNAADLEDMEKPSETPVTLKQKGLSTFLNTAALKKYLFIDPELHDASEFEDENLTPKSSELVFFKQFKSQFQNLKNRLLKFEADIKEIDYFTLVIEAKMASFNSKLKKLTQQIFALHIKIKNSTTLDEYTKSGMLKKYESVNEKLSKLQEALIGQENLFAGMIKYYDEVFNKNICENLMKDKLFDNMFEYLKKTNEFFDKGISEMYNDLLNDYTDLDKHFIPEKTSFWKWF